MGKPILSILSLIIIVMIQTQSAAAQEACDLDLENNLVIIDENDGATSSAENRVCANPDDSQRVLGNFRCRMSGNSVKSDRRDVRFTSRTGAQISEELKRGIGISSARVMANPATDAAWSHATAIQYVRHMRASVGIYTSTTLFIHAGGGPNEMSIGLRVQAQALDNMGRSLAITETNGTLRIKDAACQRALQQYFANKKTNSVPDCIYNQVTEAEEKYTDTGMNINAKPHSSPAFAAGRTLMQKLNAGCKSDSLPTRSGPAIVGESDSASAR